MNNVIKFPDKPLYKKVIENGILNRAVACPNCGKKLFYLVGFNKAACYKCKTEFTLELDEE